MPEHSRRGRNWHTAMGLLFIVSAAIVIVRQLVLVGPEFFYDYVVSNEITNEKISLGMAAFGAALVAYGLRSGSQAM